MNINLRGDVQLKTEQIILQINEISTKTIEEIDEYEQEMTNFNKINTQSLKVLINSLKIWNHFMI